MKFAEYVPPELDLGWGDITELPQRLGHHPAWPSQAITVPSFRMLLSYHYYKKLDLDEWLDALDAPCVVFADCGAYSATTQGVNIDIDTYAQWCLKYQHRLFAVSSLDAIGDPVTTLRNQRTMEELGVDALPVFHVGEDFRYLEAYCEQYPYVCLGGMVGYSGNLDNWLGKCFTVAERYGTGFHGFGMTRDPQLRTFPFFSVDSSSWSRSFRYGLLDFWNEQTTEWNVVHWEQIDDRFAELVADTGVDPAEVRGAERLHRGIAIAMSAVGWLRYAEYLRALHGPVELRDQSRPPGLHLFLVDSQPDNWRVAVTHSRDHDLLTT